MCGVWRLSRNAREALDLCNMAVWTGFELTALRWDSFGVLSPNFREIFWSADNQTPEKYAYQPSLILVKPHFLMVCEIFFLHTVRITQKTRDSNYYNRNITLMKTSLQPIINAYLKSCLPPYYLSVSRIYSIR